MNNKIHNFGWLSIFMVVAIGLLDLIGWFYNITFLKSILSNWAPMKMITACCLLASCTRMARRLLAGICFFDRTSPDNQW